MQKDIQINNRIEACTDCGETAVRQVRHPKFAGTAEEQVLSESSREPSWHHVIKQHLYPVRRYGKDYTQPVPDL